jgi:hypothetical protein
MVLSLPGGSRRRGRARGPRLRMSVGLVEDGGDEETRTPDPLLAKEMLFQLSYVPRPGWWATLDSNQ